MEINRPSISEGKGGSPICLRFVKRHFFGEIRWTIVARSKRWKTLSCFRRKWRDPSVVSGYIVKLLPADSTRCFLKFRFRLLSNLMHTHTHTRSPYSSSLCDEGRVEKKEKKGRGRGERKKRKGLEKKADRWKRFNYRAHPLTGGGSLFAAGERKWKSLCKWRASLLRKRYFEDRVGVERIEKEKEGGGKSGKGRKRFRGCVAMSCNCMLPMKFRPCVSTSSFSVLCFRVYMCVYIYVYICTRRNNFPTFVEFYFAFVTFVPGYCVTHVACLEFSRWNYFHRCYAHRCVIVTKLLDDRYKKRQMLTGNYCPWCNKRIKKDII